MQCITVVEQQTQLQQQWGSRAVAHGYMFSAGVKLTHQQPQQHQDQQLQPQ
jgi:hypothetical protein